MRISTSAENAVECNTNKDNPLPPIGCHQQSFLNLPPSPMPRHFPSRICLSAPRRGRVPSRENVQNEPLVQAEPLLLQRLVRRRRARVRDYACARRGPRINQASYWLSSGKRKKAPAKLSSLSRTGEQTSGQHGCEALENFERRGEVLEAHR